MMYLLDTDYLVALHFPEEPTHLRAQDLTNQFLLDQDSTFSDLVLQECATVISRKYSQTAAIELLQLLRKNTGGVIPVDSQLIRATWEFFDQQTHRKTSFVDCSNVVLARELGCKVVSFDRFYEQFVDIRI